jgi:hypothetical protein
MTRHAPRNAAVNIHVAGRCELIEQIEHRLISRRLWEPRLR